jgi:hypothetical protein
MVDITIRLLHKHVGYVQIAGLHVFKILVFCVVVLLSNFPVLKLHTRACEGDILTEVDEQFCEHVDRCAIVNM